jgi:hypothetical protein
MNKYFGLFVIISLFLGGVLGISLKKRLASSLNTAASHLHSGSASAILIAENSPRIYEIVNGTVIEHANDGSSWYIGVYPQPAADAVAATYIGKGIRVYTSLCGNITEYCWDNSSGYWYKGNLTGTSGRVLSANAFTSGSSLETIYVYVQENNNTLEYIYNNGWKSPITLSF